MTQAETRRRRKAALMQLAADVLRRCGRCDDHAAAVRTLEAAAAGELVAPRRDTAAAV